MAGSVVVLFFWTSTNDGKKKNTNQTWGGGKNWNSFVIIMDLLRFLFSAHLSAGVLFYTTTVSLSMLRKRDGDGERGQTSMLWIYDVFLFTFDGLKEHKHWSIKGVVSIAAPPPPPPLCPHGIKTWVGHPWPGVACCCWIEEEREGERSPAEICCCDRGEEKQLKGQCPLETDNSSSGWGGATCCIGGE